MPTDHSQLRSSIFRRKSQESRSDTTKEDKVKLRLLLPSSLSDQHLLSDNSCGPFDEIVSVEVEEDVPTPRDHVIHVKKTSPAILHHSRLSPLDLCGAGSSNNKFASFDPLTHHRTTRRNLNLPSPPASSTSASLGGFLHNQCNKAAFSSSGSLLGDLNGVPLFFMPSLSTMLDPLTGSLDSSSSSNRSSNLHSPGRSEKTHSISISDNDFPSSPISPQDVFSTNSNKENCKIFKSTIMQTLLKTNNGNKELTSASSEKRSKKNRNSKQKAPQLPEVLVDDLKKKTNADESETVPVTPMKLTNPDIVIDDAGFIEVTNKKQKVRANRRQQHDVSKVPLTRTPIRGLASVNGSNASVFRGLPRQSAVPRWTKSTDCVKAATVVLSEVRDKFITQVAPTESTSSPRNKPKVPEWPGRPTQPGVNTPSSMETVFSKKNDKQVVTKVPEQSTKLLKIMMDSSRTNSSERLSHQHRLLADFMISTWANFSKSLH